jgi:crotonobetainyl-CoA:carnitine CoA-transferase CaiB-like acyl-CoA transferase
MNLPETIDRPLSDLRVLDLSRVLAGPFVGRALADMGADVVKVEPPEGDVTRKWGKVIAGLSGFYTQQNVGKRDICIDLRVSGGPELVADLAARADVVIENFRPGVMQQYGLDFATLAARNPRLCMLSISGFGQTGPEARRPAYAAVVHAESGLVHRQATLDGTRPADLRFSIADSNAALHGLVGLLSALLMRARTGRGQHVDVSMLESMLATDDYVHLALDGMPETEGVVIIDVWDIAGLPIVLAGDFRWIWQRLVATQGLSDPTPEGAPIPVKAKLRREAVRAFFASLADRATMIRVLDEAGLAYGEVKDSPTAVASPTLEARGAIAEVPDRAGGVRRVIQSPYRFSDAASGARAGAPYRGEHNSAVLRDWLGLGEPAIDGLLAKKVLLAELRPQKAVKE